MEKMTEENFNKMVQKAIENCEWRIDSMEIDICKGEILPCEKVINDGKCETIIKLINKLTQEGK